MTDGQTNLGLQGGLGKNVFAVAHRIHVSNSHTKFSWIWSNGLGGDSVTVRRTEAIAIPHPFFEKAWG